MDLGPLDESYEGRLGIIAALAGGAMGALRPSAAFGRVLKNKSDFPKKLNEGLDRIQDQGVRNHIEPLIVGGTYISGNRSVSNISKPGGITAAEKDFAILKAYPGTQSSKHVDGHEKVSFPDGTRASLARVVQHGFVIKIEVRAAGLNRSNQIGRAHV